MAAVRGQHPPGPASRLLGGRAAAVLLAAVTFLAVAPTLAWTEFHYSIENLNVATAMEMRRGGPWLVPSLQGLPRLAKPPLTAWLTAAAIRPSTLAAIDSADRAVRAAGYRSLAFDVRWPTLLAACGILLATYELARAAGGGGARGYRLGLTSAAACATTFFLVRECRFATTDVHLALWVAVANAALARAVFGRRYGWSLPVAGVALGMALMAKGPVGLVQTVVPVGLFVAWTSRVRRRAGEEPMADLAPDAYGRTEPRPVPLPYSRGSLGAVASKPTLPWRVPAAVGLVLMIAIGGAWFAAVAAAHEGVWQLWYAEVFRDDADDVPAGAVYAHLANLWQFGPWVLWLVLGSALAVRDDARARRATAGLFGLLLLFVPVLVMSVAKDRFDRYLLPMLPAGSLLAAVGLEALWDAAARRTWQVRALAVAHWAVVGGLAVGAPIAAAGGWLGLTTADGGPWFTGPVGAALAGGGAAVLAVGVACQRRWAGSLAAVTFALLTVGQVAYTHGRSCSGPAQADLRPAADLLRDQHPDVVLYARRSPKRNTINIHANTLSIYLNRTARWAPDFPTIDRAEAGAVAVPTTVGKREPDPPVPDGWELILKTTGADKKYVFLKPPRREGEPK